MSEPIPRFASQASTAEDLLKSHTVGLVHLSDFRKRRAEALEQKEREASDKHGGFGRFKLASTNSSTGTATPDSTGHDGVTAPQKQPSKKKRKFVSNGKLSFGVDEEENDAGNDESIAGSTAVTPKSSTPGLGGETSARGSPVPVQNDGLEKRRLGPNTGITIAPKVMTKTALLREAQTREQLRKEFLSMQEGVKATEIVVPFAFYDGTNIPGGACKVRKGDHAWVFLDRSRKVGAELGVGGGEKAISRREWARVGVDDLMLVRGEIIIPHHYEFYYFIVNKTLGPSGKPLFDYAATAKPLSSRSPSRSPEPGDYEPLSLPAKIKNKASGQVTSADQNLEGYNDDPNLTKVVDRRWYERNKHIFPASVWEEYDPGKDYAKGVRKDVEGNAFFFS